MTVKGVRRRLPKLVAQLSKNYPEVQGVAPTIEEKQVQASAPLLQKLRLPPAAAEAKHVFVVTFRNQVTAEDGTKLVATVHATLDEEGRLLKVAGSKRLAAAD
ncbi:MAG: hypothetical protein HYY26_01320 [Acidobacteria bacterium]|nr:hypothetical protein [Acidobacteriota bacterium]